MQYNETQNLRHIVAHKRNVVAEHFSANTTNIRACNIPVVLLFCPIYAEIISAKKYTTLNITLVFCVCNFV